MERLVWQLFGYGDKKIQAKENMRKYRHVIYELRGWSRPPGGGFHERQGFGPRHRILLTSVQCLTHGLCSLST